MTHGHIHQPVDRTNPRPGTAPIKEADKAAPPPPPPATEAKPEAGKGGAAPSELALNKPAAGSLSNMALPPVQKPAAPAANTPPAPTPSYGDSFGNQPYVKNGQDPKLLDLGKQAVAKDPALKDTPLGKAIGEGKMGPEQVKQLQEHLKGKGYDVGATGADGKYGPNTHQAMSDFLAGKPPAAPANPADASKPADDPANPGASPTAEESKGFEALEAKLAKAGISKEFLQAEAAKNGVPYRMALAVIQKESNGNPRVTSRAGAQGLMQLMPGTARALGVKNAMDPKQNVQGGLKYLGQQLKAFGGDRTKALAAYNAGPGNVRKYGGVPPFRETRNYVTTINGWMNGGRP